MLDAVPVVICYILGGFAIFYELFSSGHLHAATGDLSGHLNLSGAEQLSYRIARLRNVVKQRSPLHYHLRRA